MDRFLKEAIAEARQGLAEGGIPIGSVLVIDGEIVGRGTTAHPETAVRSCTPNDCLETPPSRCVGLSAATLYSTLSPCDMCSGAALLYKIPRIVVGENVNFRGPEDYVTGRGVELIVANDPECVEMMARFIATRPALWNEDIGEP